MIWRGRESSNTTTRRRRGIKSAILVGTYPPRECGIATFTRDLARGIRKADPEVNCFIIAVDDGSGLAYPEEVVRVIPENDPSAYVRAARWVNNNDIDVVCLQHEYGIFGGREGEFVLEFVDELDKLLVTTLHTILPDPNPIQRRILRALVSRSDATVVMLEEGKRLLREVYDVDVSRTYVIHHGVPEFPLTLTREEAKRRLGLGNRPVISTFGLLSEGKGIEYMIMAMPEVVRRFPDAVYLVVGETHPKVKALYGERYREGLMRLARGLGLERNVIFENRYLSLEDIILYLTATDVYVTPYLNPRQVASGTLAYAIGAGRACVSTPYLYAKEMLGDGRGLIVEFRSPKALAEAVVRILSDPRLKARLEKRALELGLQMTWPKVGLKHVELFSQLAAERGELEAEERVAPPAEEQIPLHIEVNLKGRK